MSSRGRRPAREVRVSVPRLQKKTDFDQPPAAALAAPRYSIDLGDGFCSDRISSACSSFGTYGLAVPGLEGS